MRHACKPTRNPSGKPMSYILDALKRADTERERGAVPGLHARQVTSPAIQPADHRQTRIWMAIAALLALTGLVATSLWIWRTPDSPKRLAVVEPAAPALRAEPPVAQPAPVAPAATTPIAAAPPPAPLASPAISKVAPRPVPVARPVTAPPPQLKPDPIVKEAPNRATPNAAPTPAAAPAVRSFADLPEDLRRQIPPLTITGTVYSKNPASRLLLVNNQVLPQGSLAASEVMLEEIQAKSSVFSFRGTRFRVAH